MPRKNMPSGTEGTFGYVLREFEKSPHFTTKAKSTQTEYGYILNWINRVLGRCSTLDAVNGIRPKLVQLAIDQIANTPGQQKNVLALLKTIDGWAAPREYLLRSITHGVKAVSHEGGHIPWTQPQVAIGYQHASEKLPRAIKLMAHLGQRRSDIVRMRLNDIVHEDSPFDGRRVPGINVLQQKTGLRLWIPFDEEIADLIETWRSDIRNAGAPWLLVTRPDGSPFAPKQLTERWTAEREGNEALRGLAEVGYKTKNDASLVLHGLRGTRVVSLRKAGKTVPMICSMIGMSQSMVMRYSRFADQVELALAAVHNLNAETTGERVVQLKTDKTA